MEFCVGVYIEVSLNLTFASPCITITYLLHGAESFLRS